MFLLLHFVLPVLMVLASCEEKIAKICNLWTFWHVIKATTGVCEAHLLQAYTPCVIGAIPTKTCGKVFP